MEEANRVNQDQNQKTKLTHQDKEYPTTLLDRFSPEKNLKQTHDSNSQSPPQEPDLNLSLSLSNFGSLKPKEMAALTRASSIAAVITIRKDSAESRNKFFAMARAVSLPVDAEQQQRLITVREIQAKIRILERQRLRGEAKEKPLGKSNCPPQVLSWAATSAAKCPALVKIQDGHLNDGREAAELHKGPEGSAAAKESSIFKPPSEPKNAESVGTSETTSSGKFVKPSETGIQDAEPVITSGITSIGKFVKPAESGVQNAEPVVTSGTTSSGKLVKPPEPRIQHPYKRAKISGGNFEYNGIDVMKRMPTVSTIGDGPNGRKIEGFLYKYLQGNVSIVCVCHGSFLSPAEFIKHAGGRDVPNPMKHITVYTSLSS